VGAPASENPEKPAELFYPARKGRAVDEQVSTRARRTDGRTVDSGGRETACTIKGKVNRENRAVKHRVYPKQRERETGSQGLANLESGEAP
jgi:hypothetical protein